MSEYPAKIPDPPTSDLSALIDQAAELHRLESKICARKLAVCAEVFTRYDAHAMFFNKQGIIEGDPFDVAEMELGPAMGLTPSGAGHFLDVGITLATRLPNIAAAFAAGELDLFRVKIIVSATSNVEADKLKEVEGQLLTQLGKARNALSGNKLRATVDRIIASVDADGLRERRRKTVHDRSVGVRPSLDGMATVDGFLPAEDGSFLDRRLHEMAERVCSNDPRNFGARRADALMTLIRGEAELLCQCDNTDCAYKTTAGGGTPRKVLVHVIAREDTLDGANDLPGWLDGHGPLDADHVRELAKDAARRVLVDPTAASRKAREGESHYRPSQSLADWVRARDGYCQFPGCPRAAWSCDVDHADAYDHTDPAAGGQTTSANTGAFCRSHHLGKTFAGWDLDKRADGTAIIVSPLGRKYPVPAQGPLVTLAHPVAQEFAEPSAPLKPKQRNRIEQRAERATYEREQRHKHRAEAQEARQREHEEHLRQLREDPTPPPF